jgi:transposase
MYHPPIRLWLFAEPVDMRKQFDGLTALVRQSGMSPLSGDGFLFINRRRTQIKCLYFVAGGYCLWVKRLEQGQFATLQSSKHEQKIQLSPMAFLGLLEGLDFEVKRRRKRWDYSRETLSYQGV